MVYSDFDIGQFDWVRQINTAGTATTFNLYGMVYADGMSVSPVPEPETWLMWAVGLPLLALRRRRAHSAWKFSLNSCNR